MISHEAYQVRNNGTSSLVTIQYDGLQLCGSGRFANVYACNLRAPLRRKMALKNIWPQEQQKLLPVEKYPEIQTLSMLYHPNIANLQFFFTRTLENAPVHGAFLDYMPSDMAKLRKTGGYDSLDAKLYIYQLFCAIAYLERNNVIHLDIKPANIIIDIENGLLKLADFGNAKKMESNQKSGTNYQVTRYYRPPELLFGSDMYNSAIDVWSAACVSYEFYSNQILFKGNDTDDQIRLTIAVFGYPTDSDIKSMKIKRPRVAKKTAKGIETYTGNTLDEQVYAMLKATLVMNPANRKTAAEVLKMPLFEVLLSDPPPSRSDGKPIPNLSNCVDCNYQRPAKSCEESSPRESSPSQ